MKICWLFYDLAVLKLFSFNYFEAIQIYQFGRHYLQVAAVGKILPETSNGSLVLNTCLLVFTALVFPKNPGMS